MPVGEKSRLRAGGAAIMVDVLAVFITLAVEGEERAYSVRLSVPASWKQKPMEALLRAFVKRANRTEAFASGALDAKDLQLERVKDIGVSLLGDDVACLFTGSRRADLVATKRSVGGRATIPALSDVSFGSEAEKAAGLFQFMAILEQVRQSWRQKALADGAPLAVGASRIDRAMAQAIAAATGVAADALVAPVGRDNWYERVHAGVLKIVPEAFVAMFTEDRKPTPDEAKLLAEYTSKEESNNRGLLTVLTENDPRGIRVAVASERVRTYCVEPLTRTVGFGVPGDQALKLAASAAPLIEVGAGTGYWTALLRARGVDVDAYDVAPPTDAMNNEFFFQQSFPPASTSTSRSTTRDVARDFFFFF